MRFLLAILVVLALTVPAYAQVCGPNGCRRRPAAAMPRIQLRTETVVESKSTPSEGRVSRDRPLLRAVFRPFRAAAQAVRGMRARVASRCG